MPHLFTLSLRVLEPARSAQIPHGRECVRACVRVCVCVCVRACIRWEQVVHGRLSISGCVRLAYSWGQGAHHLLCLTQEPWGLGGTSSSEPLQWGWGPAWTERDTLDVGGWALLFRTSCLC